MTTKPKVHDIWHVSISERLYSGTATKSEGEYLVRISVSDAAAYLQHQFSAHPWKEEEMGESEVALVAREVVEWHFHLAYSRKACVTVSCGAQKSEEALPTRAPDNIVAGIPVWELAVK